MKRGLSVSFELLDEGDAVAIFERAAVPVN